MKILNARKKAPVRTSPDLALLKIWKKASTKTKLQWLESALVFGKLKKFKI